MTGFSTINTQQGSLFGAFYSKFRVLEAQGGTSEEESKQVGRAGFSAIKHSAREPIWGFLEQIAEKAGKRSRSLEKAQRKNWEEAQTPKKPEALEKARPRQVGGH